MAAPYVCVTCKARKRACDKTLPSCTYCTQKAIACHYLAPQSSRIVECSEQAPEYIDSYNLSRQQTLVELAPDVKSDLLLLHSVSDHAYLIPKNGLPGGEDGNHDNVWHKRVTRLIQTTGLSVVDVRERYLNGQHQAFPILITRQFKDYQDMVVSARPPPMDVSVLMLATALLVVDPRRDHRPTQLADQTSFYLTTKMLYAKLQALTPVSIPMIQTGIILSTYELLSGHSQAAVLSIGACGLMTKLGGIAQSCMPRATSTFPPPTFLEHLRWCIMICERIITCDIRSGDSIPVLQFPNIEGRVPPEPETGYEDEIASHSVSHRPLLRDISTGVRGFPRTAQAAWLLDRVLFFVKLPLPLGPHQSRALAINRDLQDFLNTSLELDARYGRCCSPIAITICAMFEFHRYIVNISHNVVGLEEWNASSHAALNTTTHLMVDMARSHKEGQFLTNIDAVPLTWRCNTRGALDHLRSFWDADKKTPCQSEYEGIQQLKGLVSSVENRWCTIDL